MQVGVGAVGGDEWAVAVEAAAMDCGGHLKLVCAELGFEDDGITDGRDLGNLGFKSCEGRA